MLQFNAATGEPFLTPDRLSLRTRLGADIWIEGLTTGAPATVEIAVRPKGQRSRRLRIRRVGDGSITFGATQHHRKQGLLEQTLLSFRGQLPDRTLGSSPRH